MSDGIDNAPYGPQNKSQKGKPGGYAPLGTDGLVPAEYLPGGGGGYTATPFRKVTSSPYTIASTDVRLLVAVSITISLPAPTAGRELRLRARDGDARFTTTGNHVETFAGVLSDHLDLFDGYGCTLVGDGTDWIQFPG